MTTPRVMFVVVLPLCARVVVIDAEVLFLFGARENLGGVLVLVVVYIS